MKSYVIASLLAVFVLGITACSDTPPQKPSGTGLTVKEIEEVLRPQGETQGQIGATPGMSAGEREELEKSLQKVQQLEKERRQEEIDRQLEQDRILEQWKMNQQILKEQQARDIQRQIDRERNRSMIPPAPSYTPPPPRPTPVIPYSPGGRF